MTTALANKIKEAKKLHDGKHFTSSIDEYGKILEAIFEELYKEYFPYLTDEVTEKVVEYRRKTGKKIDRFTIGEWIGLFRVANLFGVIECHRKKPDQGNFVFFTTNVAAAVNEIRNRNVHSEKDLNCYNEEQVAMFTEASILCMLKELEMFSEVELANKPEQGQQKGIMKQEDSLSRDDILGATTVPAINDFKFSKKYVEIEGKKYPAKGLVSVALGVSPANINLDVAEKTLRRLGFSVLDVEEDRKATEMALQKNGVDVLGAKSVEDILLHVTVTKLFENVNSLILETKRRCILLGMKTDQLTLEFVKGTIKTAWNQPESIIGSFKNDAFRYYLEELLEEKFV